MLFRCQAGKSAVGILPVAGERVERFDGGWEFGAGVEFIAPCAVETFDAAVDLGDDLCLRCV
jgi:hypothetical protein